MANNKSIIRELNLQNTAINLNKNKSIISDFAGFNKNTGVWFNNVLSNLYCNDDKTADDIITVDKDVYRIVDGTLYKNDVLLKDYSNVDKVKTEVLGNIADNVIAYTPLVHIYYEGNNAYVKYTTDATDVVVPVGSYDANLIPYIVVDKEADTWCALYGHYAVCKGMTTAAHYNSIPTVALYSETDYQNYIDKIWWVVDGATLYNVESTSFTPVTLNLSAPIIQGAVTVNGWTPTFKAIQTSSRSAFFAIEDLDVSDTPTVTLDKDTKFFNYLKGFYVEGTRVDPAYSTDGDAIDMSVVPDTYDIQVQPYKAWNKLASLKTKFLSYHSYLTIPYGTKAHISSGTDVTVTSVDGPTAYLLESRYSQGLTELITLTGSTAGIKDAATSMFFNQNSVKLEASDFPKLLGLFNSDYTPEWLFTNTFGFKLIYNKDALVGISKNDSIVVPWNDVDENTLTIAGDDIYYYSLNSDAWMHINVNKENELKAIKIGNNLLLNSLKDNCYKEDIVSTYNVDVSLADFVVSYPRVGLINLYGINLKTYFGDYNLGNNWLTKMLEYIKNAEEYYISLNTENNGPIWAASTMLNYTKATNARKEGWQYTLTPSLGTQQIFDYGYYLNKMSFYSRASVDAYTSSIGSVLSYFKSWYNGAAKYNNKLADTEKSMTEPTYYNLSPNIDIMTFIDGFNTISLVKVGNNTVQLLVKESELLLIYNILSGVSNISDYFVLQGQQYAIINNYINKVDMANGQVVAQTPITSVEGLKFLGNTDRQAFFFSQMNKTILYFAADNTLEFLMDATELDSNTTTVFAKQTNDIFLLLNDKVVVFTNSGSMFEILSRAEYITFGENNWSDGNKTWSYYKIDQEQERVPIELETLWYGNTINRKPMTVDCVYIELYDDNYMPGKFEISLDSLMNNTVSTKKQTFNVKSSDYDRITKTVYLRYQPSAQNCAAFKLNINSDLPIKRLAIGYVAEGISLISKNNI